MSHALTVQPPSPPRTPTSHHDHDHDLAPHPSATSAVSTTPAPLPPTPMSSPPQAPSPTAPSASTHPAMARLHPHTQPTSASPSVRCLVRTRIPTRFGADVYVHLYHNSLDNKEHLALVFGPRIRSRTLDVPHADAESDADRLTRGASVPDPAGVSTGPRVHPRHASRAAASGDEASGADEPPLVRLHSECFTGETISSVRCDCGDQLDEAMRLMSVEGNGVIVYLRQEGRGIGLLEKLRAYNLQDQGHDTVTANLLLNHPADLRTYDVASLILTDLGIHQVRLLTNNPDKMEQIAKVGIQVVDRVGMIPTHWTTASAAATPRPHGLAHVLSGKPHAVLASSPSSEHGSPEHVGERRKATVQSKKMAARTMADETECGFDSQNERPFTPPAHHAACCHASAHHHHHQDATADVDDDASSYSDWEEGSSGSERPAAPAAPPAANRHASDSRLYSASTSPAPPGRPASATARSSPLAAPVFPEMEAYLRTKVERMRHIIDLSASPVAGMSASSLMGSASDGEGQGDEEDTEASRGDPQMAEAANGEVVAVAAVLDAREHEAFKVVSPRPVPAALVGTSGGPTQIAFTSVGVTYGG